MQDKRYVLSCFGKSLSSGRDNYYAYLKDGLDQGRRPELVWGLNSEPRGVGRGEDGEIKGPGPHEG